MSSNFTLLGLILITATIWLMGFLGLDLPLGILGQRAWMLMTVVSVTYLVVNGRTYLKPRFVWWGGGLMLLGAIGLLFKLLHLPYGNTGILIAMVGIILSYSVVLFKKAKRSALDWMKWAWVLGFFTAYIQRLFHWNGPYPFSGLQLNWVFVFWLGWLLLMVALQAYLRSHQATDG